MKTEPAKEIGTVTFLDNISITRFSEFLRNLPFLLPNDSILCSERVINSDIETFQQQRPAVRK
jgi:hypothetical protein